MTDAISLIRTMFEHVAWADAQVGRALTSAAAPAAAVREYAHVVGVEEVWLARVQRRTPALAVWPEIDAGAAMAEGARVLIGYSALLGTLDGAALEQTVTYTNSARREFSTPLIDILTHVALHGQYHRGKVNLVLRQNGLEPAPTDFIGFTRGVPAATQADTARVDSSQRSR